jgi:hypothetical protein
MVASLAYRKSFDRRPRYPLALSRTLLRRSLLAGALVALGILVVRLSPDPHAQVVVFRFRPPISPVASAPNFSGAGGGRLPLSQWNGRFSLIRASSVESSTAPLARWRLRFALLDTNKCRRPAWPRNTLPVAVILKRLATAFFVLRLAIGFGIGSREPILLNPLRNWKLLRIKAERQTCTDTIRKPSLPHVQRAPPGSAPSFPVRDV